MITRIRPRLTYANIVSTACLFAVLGGSATAATLLVTGRNVKNGSLTGADVKDNSLSSPDIRDGGLLAKDFKLGQLPAGPAGPQGVPGPQGPQGAPGPSDAYNQGLYPGSSGLSLAAGDYLVHASIQENNTTGSAIDVTCTLEIGSASDATGIARDIKTVTIPAGAKTVVPLAQIHTLTGPGPANASCTGPTSWNGLVIALRVGTVHEI